MSTIFRKASLARLSSPEQLDTLLEVTTPKGWLALLAILCLVGGALTWSFAGRLATHVSGSGILVRKGGLASVDALAAGQLKEILVRTGDEVRAGQRVARLVLPDLQAELERSRAGHRALQQQHEQLQGFSVTDLRLQGDAAAQRRKIAEEQIAAARERARLLESKLATQQRLLDDGLLTDQAVQTTRDGLLQAREEIERAKGALKELTVRQSELRQQSGREDADRQIRLDELRLRIADLEEKIRQSTEVSSPAAGRVIELRAAVGSVVTAGTALVLLELAGERGQGLEAIVYVPGSDGKKVHPGMAVEVSPSTVRREEYGALRGRVNAVSAFPSTNQAMIARLGNQELAASFFRAIDTPIELRVDVLPSRDTASGYAWTSPAGPPQVIQPGTLCTTLIQVSERAPITLVVPLLRRKLDL